MEASKKDRVPIISASTKSPSNHERQTGDEKMNGPSYEHSSPSQTSRGSLRQRANAPNSERRDGRTLSSNGRQEDDNFAGRNENLSRFGLLEMCSDPYCTICPSSYKSKKQHKMSTISHAQFINVLCGFAKGWARRFCCFLRPAGRRFCYFLRPFIPGVMNPHSKVVRLWNKFFVISCLVAVFFDPLFFFALSVIKDNKCIVINWPMTTTIVVLRSLTDFIHAIHVLIQFRLAYVVPESRVVGGGHLVDDPKEIARNYLSGYFIIDVFVALPLPQIIIFLVLPHTIGSSGANNARNLLQVAILVQYIPRLCRVLPFVSGLSPTGLIFESLWANFVINLLTFVLAGHVVGSCWYLFGLQRVNQCLQNACHDSKLTNCTKFIDCGHGNTYKELQNDPMWEQWKSNENATTCIGRDTFSYGIYVQAIGLTTEQNIATRYIYSFFWGFQQISTLAGNLVPSYFVGEVLFTLGIIGIGLLLFALLIGNIQTFLQVLGNRMLKMSLRRQDVEQWMSHRDLPEELRRKVRRIERYNLSARVNEEKLLESLHEDLQIEIRSHLLKSTKIRFFQNLHGPVIDAICNRVRTKTYLAGSKILYPGGLINKMVVIKRGKMVSIGDDGKAIPLSEGGVCGEELLTWYLEHSSANRDGSKLFSNRLVGCVTNVEAFVWQAADFEEVTRLFARLNATPEALRYISYWHRHLAALRIQNAWRSRMNWLNFAARRIQVAWRSSRMNQPLNLAARKIQVAWRSRMKRVIHRNTVPQLQIAIVP